MKRRGRIALVAALAVFAISVFFSLIWSFSAKNAGAYTILLPGQGSATIDATQDLGKENAAVIQAVVIDAANVQQVIARLHRPDAYHMTVETSYYYSDTSQTLKSLCWAKNGASRITQYNADGKPKEQILMTEDWVYLWGEDEAYRQFALQAGDRDYYARSPSYETVVALPPEQVLEGGTTQIDGRLCVYAKTLDARTGQEQTWYILAENGLLLLQETKNGEQVTLRTKMTSMTAEAPEDGLFLLPDGTLPQ